MPSLKRIKTNYPGVFYIDGISITTGKPDKIFYIRYRKDGKLVEEPAGRQEKQMTAAKASHLRTEKVTGKKPTRREARAEKQAVKWTIAKLWLDYCQTKQIKGIAQDRSRYEKYIKPTFGDKEPDTITPVDIDRLRLRILKDKAPQTVKLTLALLRRIVNFGHKRRLCSPLSFALELPKVNNVITEDLTQEQISRLVKVIETEFFINPAAQMMKLVLLTGLRRSELFRLQWSDIDEKGFLHIIDPKGGANAKIPISPNARECLDMIPRDDSPFVFPGRGGGQRTEIRRGANRIKALADLPAKFRALHGLRHVYASILASSGQVDLHTISKLLTHKSERVTLRYAHLRDSALQRAAELAGDIISQAERIPFTSDKDK